MISTFGSTEWVSNALDRSVAYNIRAACSRLTDCVAHDRNDSRKILQWSCRLFSWIMMISTDILCVESESRVVKEESQTNWLGGQQSQENEKFTDSLIPQSEKSSFIFSQGNHLSPAVNMKTREKFKNWSKMMVYADIWVPVFSNTMLRRTTKETGLLL